MYGLRHLYKIDKKIPFFKCESLMNNAKFAVVINSKKNEATIFTTLRRHEAQKEVVKFLEKAKDIDLGIEQGNYFIILDNILEDINE